MSAVLAVTVLVFWLAFPGVLALASLSAYRQQKPACWILGSVLGLAVASVLQVIASYWYLSSFTTLWCGVSAVALVAWWRSGRGSLLARPSPHDLTLCCLLLTLAAVRIAFILRNELPHGWDPSFHCLLAENIFQNNAMVFDWRPFEDISLNYPVAGFIGIAWVKQLTGLDSHIVHKVLQALHNVMTAATVFLLAARVGKSKELGLCSCAAFGFWALAGNLQYFIYGGFPNQLGMLYILAAYLFLTESPRPGPRKFYAAVLLAAVFLTHHHVLLSTFLVLGILIVYDLFRGQKRRARDLLQTIAGGALLCSFYLIPYALKILTLGNTSVATYPEGAYGPPAVVSLIGPLFLAACCYGIWLAKKRGFSDHERQLLAVIGCLVLLFVGLDWVARYLRWLASGQAFGLFTPWRFLCNATPFLAYFAGSACLNLGRKLHLSTYLCLIAISFASLTNLATYRELWETNYSSDVIRASRYLKENTPPDTIVLTPINWVPYLSQRRTALSPLPSSEPSTRGTPKRQQIEALFRGELPSSGTGPMICDLRYGLEWPGSLILWRDPQNTQSPMVVLQIIRPEGIVPMTGWSLDPW